MTEPYLALGRLVLAGSVLVLAAVVMTMSGSGGFAGRLGGLFGVEARTAEEPVHVVRLAEPQRAAAVASFRHAAPAGAAPVALRRRGQTKQGVPPAPLNVRSGPGAGGGPVPAPPAPPPAPPPVEAPRPAPAPRGIVDRTVETVRTTVAPTAPPAQPVLDRTAAAVGQVCGVIGGCP
jgi:hypothetical protein